MALVLWSTDIAASPGSGYLFARGISYYDVGYSFDEMIDAALGPFTTDTPQQFAARLARNVSAGKTAAEWLALMNGNGGGAAGEAGRHLGTRQAAEHADTLRNVELAGLTQNGVVCDLYADGNMLFWQRGQSPVG